MAGSVNWNELNEARKKLCLSIDEIEKIIGYQTSQAENLIESVIYIGVGD